MRYELSDYEWTAIKTMLPNKPRGARRANETVADMQLIWVRREGKYFCKWDWTGKLVICPSAIRLNRFNNFR